MPGCVLLHLSSLSHAKDFLLFVALFLGEAVESLLATNSIGRSAFLGFKAMIYERFTSQKEQKQFENAKFRRTLLKFYLNG